MKKITKSKYNETLNERYDSKNNIFGILSIIASLLIILFHSYPLFYGINTKKTDIFTQFFSLENLGSIVVATFFVISGFMITTSIKNSKNVIEYLKKRVLKIFPTLIFCLLICALVVAPIITDISKWEYLKTPSLYTKYIIDNLLLWKNTIYGISGIFINNPYTGVINGSIWTLKHQFLMYLLIIPIYHCLLKKEERHKYFNFLFLIVFLITAVSFSGKYNNIIQEITTFGLKWNIGVLAESNQLIRLTYYFLAGVFMNIHQNKIFYSKKNIFMALIVLLLTRNATVITNVSAMILIPYITMYLGTFKNKLRIRIPDFSYQVYVFAFPIQQLIVYYFYGKVNFICYVILCILTSAICGFIGYYICEYPLKRRKKVKSKLA